MPNVLCVKTNISSGNIPPQAMPAEKILGFYGLDNEDRAFNNNVDTSDITNFAMTAQIGEYKTWEIDTIGTDLTVIIIK